MKRLILVILIALITFNLLSCKIKNVAQLEPIIQNKDINVFIDENGNNYAIIDQKLWTWGLNSNIDASEIIRKPYIFMQNVKNVYNGDAINYALKTDGSLWEWGTIFESDNQENKFIPPHKILDDVKEYVGDDLAIKNDKSLWSCGEDDSTPQKILDDVKQYKFDLAITNNGDLWELNYEEDNKTKLKKILDKVESIEAGSFVIRKDKSLWGWGQNYSGELGDGTCKDRLSPIKIMDNVNSIKQINFDETYYATYAIKTDDSLWAWGNNQDGNIGNGKKEKTCAKPYKILDNVASIENIECYDIYALKKDGTLWAWGDNSSGQLGNGSNKDILTPTKIMDGVKQVKVLLFEACISILKEDDSLWYLGAGNKELMPKKLLDSVSEIYGYYYECFYAIQKDGTMWSYGEDPLEKKIDNVKSFVYNNYYGGDVNYIIKKDNSLWAWGDNDNGQLGDGSTKDSQTPIEIKFETSVN